MKKIVFKSFIFTVLLLNSLQLVVKSNQKINSTNLSIQENFNNAGDNLDEDEYIKTIFHELVHCIQDIRGISDNNSRECEAYKLEQLFYDNFMLTEASKVSL